jgi:hypothetical protein
MEEGRKRVIGIMAAILASLHMQSAEDDLFGGPQGNPRADRLIEASSQANWSSSVRSALRASEGRLDLA